MTALLLNLLGTSMLVSGLWLAMLAVREARR
jgi:hypothetical protein